MLSTVASIISAFGIAMLVFRIQRELAMQKAGEMNWIPQSDWLLVWATEISLLLVLLPLLIAPRTSRWIALPVAGCASACVLVAGYIPAVFAHYRLILSGKRSGPRANPEPSERLIVLATVVAAVLLAALMLSKLLF